MRVFAVVLDDDGSSVGFDFWAVLLQIAGRARHGFVIDREHFFVFCVRVEQELAGAVGVAAEDEIREA